MREKQETWMYLKKNDYLCSDFFRAESNSYAEPI